MWKMECRYTAIISWRARNFSIKSDREVRKVVNGSFNKINDVYYVITAFEPDFTVLYM